MSGEHPIPTSPSTPTPPREPPSPPPPPSPLDRAFLTDQPGTGMLILVRHGQQRLPNSRDNVAVREWVDPPLSDIGQRQAEVVGTSLATESIDAVYCSHLTRAHETGQQIGKHHGLEPVVLQELREIEIFRDLPRDSNVREAINEPLRRGMQERFVKERRWDVYPYSESSDEFSHRVVTTIEGIVATNPSKCVAIACHAGVINAYVAHILALREDMFFRPGHASVSRVRTSPTDGRRVVHTLNELHHLAEVDAALVTF